MYFYWALLWLCETFHFISVPGRNNVYFVWLYWPSCIYTQIVQQSPQHYILGLKCYDMFIKVGCDPRTNTYTKCNKIVANFSMKCKWPFLLRIFGSFSYIFGILTWLQTLRSQRFQLNVVKPKPNYSKSKTKVIVRLLSTLNWKPLYKMITSL